MTSSDLCTACGLCCDGTLFAAAPLGPEEIAAVEALGLTAVPGQESAFRLGCSRLEGTCCGVYDRRPAVCRKFRCHLLRRFNTGDVSATEALEIVRKARGGRARTWAAFADLVPGAHSMNSVELQAAAPKADALRADQSLAVRWGAALTQMAWLVRLLRSEFRPKKEDRRAEASVRME